jgi:hypothetical protein
LGKPYLTSLTLGNPHLNVYSRTYNDWRTLMHISIRHEKYPLYNNITS